MTTRHDDLQRELYKNTEFQHAFEMDWIPLWVDLHNEADVSFVKKITTRHYDAYVRDYNDNPMSALDLSNPDHVNKPQIILYPKGYPIGTRARNQFLVRLQFLVVCMIAVGLCCLDYMD